MKESIKNVWAILAQSSAIDKDNNTVSLFDIIEEVTFNVGGSVPEKVGFPFNYHLITLWEREKIGEKIELKFKMVLRDPKNQILGENEGLIKMESQHKRFRFRAQFQGMSVTGPGVYRYDIISLEPSKTDNKELITSVAFEIKIVLQPVKSPITL